MLYPKDTEKWKQFTTIDYYAPRQKRLCCIPKILKNESNSQQLAMLHFTTMSCVVSQRYWKMKAIHNRFSRYCDFKCVVLYPKDTEKWKQFTTQLNLSCWLCGLCCMPKILKNESNSQLIWNWLYSIVKCVVSFSLKSYIWLTKNPTTHVLLRRYPNHQKRP